MIKIEPTQRCHLRFKKKGLHSLSLIKALTKGRPQETYVNISYNWAKLLDLIPE